MMRAEKIAVIHKKLSHCYHDSLCSIRQFKVSVFRCGLAMYQFQLQLQLMRAKIALRRQRRS